MAIRKPKKPRPVRPQVLETYWVADDAIDQKASDVSAWERTADPSKLVIKPNKKPDKIRYRALNSVEARLLVERGMHIDGSPTSLYFLEAARFGIVSIDGVQLSRTNVEGIRGLSDESLAELMGIQEPMNWTNVLCALGSKIEGGGEPIQTTLPEWVGVHIVAGTFRDR